MHDNAMSETEFKRLVKGAAQDGAAAAVGVIQKGLDRQTTRFNDLFKGTYGESALPATPANEENKGVRLGQLVRAYTGAQGNKELAARMATEKGFHSSVSKALAAGDFDAGGALVPEDLANEIIDLLRPRSVVRRNVGNVVTLPRGSKSFPVITSGAAVGYFLENGDMDVSEPKFGRLTLTARKLGVLVPLSNEMIRFTGDGADTIIANHLVDQLAAAENRYFLHGTGTQGQPKGLRNLASPTTTIASSWDGSGANPSRDHMQTDIVAAVTAMQLADIPMARPIWVMNPATATYLANVLNDNGTYAYPEMRTATPLLNGYRVETTTAMPRNLGTGADETDIMLIDFNEVVIGEERNYELELSNSAAYSIDGSVASAFQRDQTLLRIIAMHDIALRYPEAVAVITGVKY